MFKTQLRFGSPRVWVFWISLALLSFLVTGAAYLDIRDTEGRPARCETPSADKSAYLVLNQLDSGSKRIKASLMVPSYVPGKESKRSLQLDSVALEPNSASSAPQTAPLPQPTPKKKTYDSLLDLPAGTEITSSSVWHEVYLPYESRSFFYPFENYSIDLRIVSKDDQAPAALKLEVQNHIDELILDPCAAHYSFESAGENNLPVTFRGNPFTIKLRRHRFVRAIASILYGVAIVFLLYIAQREEPSKVLTNSLGYIAALWGIRQIIVGYAKLFPTAVDFVTLALYVSVVAIIVYKLLLTKTAEPEPLPLRFRRLKLRSEERNVRRNRFRSGR